jgi:hypothetical protein
MSETTETAQGALITGRLDAVQLAMLLDFMRRWHLTERWPALKMLLLWGHEVMFGAGPQGSLFPSHPPFSPNYNARPPSDPTVGRPGLLPDAAYRGWPEATWKNTAEMGRVGAAAPTLEQLAEHETERHRADFDAAAAAAQEPEDLAYAERMGRINRAVKSTRPSTAKGTRPSTAKGTRPSTAKGGKR